MTKKDLVILEQCNHNPKKFKEKAVKHLLDKGYLVFKHPDKYAISGKGRNLLVKGQYDAEESTPRVD